MARGTVLFREDECKGCGLCVKGCPPKVLHLAERLNHYGYHPAEYVGEGCTGCGICFYCCPEPGALTVYLFESGAPAGIADCGPDGYPSGARIADFKQHGPAETA